MYGTGILVLLIKKMILETYNKALWTILESIMDLIQINQRGIRSRGLGETRLTTVVILEAGQ